MIFIGALFPKEREAEILEKTPSHAIQNQANNFEWNLLEGFRDNGVELRVINVLPVGTFPRRYKELLLKDSFWGEDGRNFEVGSVNLPLLKQFSRYRKIKKAVAESDEKDIVIYSAYLPFLKAVYKLDKKYKVTLIVTDLPEYYDLRKTNYIKRILRKLNNRRIKRCLNRVDKFVLLTEQMKYPLKVGDRPYVVVEGISNNGLRREETIQTDKFIVVYAGTLNLRFGVKNLIDAVCLMNSDKIELHLFGSGDAVSYIKETAAEHSGIVFHGFVSKQELIAFYSKTDLLINPRMNDGDYTQYSFPSKTMEYLASGIPVVAYKLSGIPNEYDNYLNYIPDTSVDSLANIIKQISEDRTGEYLKRAHEGQLFVETQKNPAVQVKKIIGMMTD